MYDKMYIQLSTQPRSYPNPSTRRGFLRALFTCSPLSPIADAASAIQRCLLARSSNASPDQTKRKYVVRVCTE